MEQKEIKSLQAFAAKIRIAALDAIHSIGQGHVGGAFSIADVLAVLYGREMKVNPADPNWADRDKLVVSKGHAGPAVYGTLALMGFFPYEELKTLNQGGTRLPSHCDRNKTPGVDVTTGSLGQGTSQAVGVALGDKIKGRSSRTFLIVGDGESEEGQCWEAFAFASAKKLGNLVVFIDWNKRQLDGTLEEVLPMGDYVKKMEAFGFDTVMVDGGDVEAIAAALERTRAGGEKPYAIILDTIKGHGVKEIEETRMNHSLPVNDEKYARWTAELRANLAEWEA
ncbi:MAG: transketolase [Clostridia bacterium]|jgi:transketolase|nr:transketolase [Clostridia bacterium]